MHRFDLPLGKVCFARSVLIVILNLELFGTVVSIASRWQLYKIPEQILEMVQMGFLALEIWARFAVRPYSQRW